MAASAIFPRDCLKTEATVEALFARVKRRFAAPARHSYRAAAPTAAEGGDSRVRVLLSRLQIEDEMHIRFDGVYAAGEGDLLTFPRGA